MTTSTPRIENPLSSGILQARLSAEKAQKSLETIANATKKDTIIQVLQLMRERNIDDDGDRIEEQLKRINGSMHGGMGLGGSPSSSSGSGGSGKMQGPGVDLERRKQFRTLGVRVNEFKDSAKDFFTARGFLDKTGIARRGSGSLLSEHLDKAEFEKKGFVGPDSKNPFKMQKDTTPGIFSGWMKDKESTSRGAMSDDKEMAQENQRSMDLQTNLLQEIADNTHALAVHMGAMSKKKPESTSKGKAEQGGIGSALKKGILEKMGWGGRGATATPPTPTTVPSGAKAAPAAAPAAASAGGSGIGTALLAGTAMVAAPWIADWALGKAGVGSKEIDTKQDDANWDRMNWWQKIESGAGRGIEKIGGIFGGNISKEAKASRIAAETEYFRKQDEKAGKTAKSGVNPAAANGAVTTEDESAAETARLLRQNGGDSNQSEAETNRLNRGRPGSKGGATKDGKYSKLSFDEKYELAMKLYKEGKPGFTLDDTGQLIVTDPDFLETRQIRWRARVRHTTSSTGGDITADDMNMKPEALEPATSAPAASTSTSAPAASTSAPATPSSAPAVPSSASSSGSTPMPIADTGLKMLWKPEVVAYAQGILKQYPPDKYKYVAPPAKEDVGKFNIIDKTTNEVVSTNNTGMVKGPLGLTSSGIKGSQFVAWLNKNGGPTSGGAGEQAAQAAPSAPQADTSSSLAQPAASSAAPASTAPTTAPSAPSTGATPSTGAAEAPKSRFNEKGGALEDGKYSKLPFDEKYALAMKFYKEGKPGFQMDSQGYLIITDPDFLEARAKSSRMRARQTTSSTGGEITPEDMNLKPQSLSMGNEASSLAPPAAPAAAAPSAPTGSYSGQGATGSLDKEPVPAVPAVPASNSIQSIPGAGPASWWKPEVVARAKDILQKYPPDKYTYTPDGDSIHIFDKADPSKKVGTANVQPSNINGKQLAVWLTKTGGGGASAAPSAGGGGELTPTGERGVGSGTSANPNMAGQTSPDFVGKRDENGMAPYATGSSQWGKDIAPTIGKAPTQPEEKTSMWSRIKSAFTGTPAKVTTGDKSSGQAIEQGTTDVKKAEEDRQKAAVGGGASVQQTTVNNQTGTTVTKFDLPTRKNDESLNNYTASRLVY